MTIGSDAFFMSQAAKLAADTFSAAREQAVLLPNPPDGLAPSAPSNNTYP